MHYRRFFYLLLSAVTVVLEAQYKAQTLRGWERFDENIGNIQFYPEGKILDSPIISLYDVNPLVLKFDVLKGKEEQLAYSVEHCNSDWTTSDLDEMEYIEGFTENTFYALSTSFNTTYDYIHYQLRVPNDEIKFLISGNYILHIYNADTKKEVLSRRFIIYEPVSEVDIQLDKFQTDLYSGEQELHVKVSPQTIDYSTLVGNIKLAVMQNNNWHLLKYFEKYNSDANGNIMFNRAGQIVYNGMNEYRICDLKSLKFISERVQYIDFQPPYYHVFLKPDKLRGNKEYFSNLDLNGQFYIWNQETHDDDLLDADYAFVHFEFQTEMPLASEIYIEGAITDWQLSENYLKYNTETGSYEAVLLLKQGIYNYRYVTKDYDSPLVYCDITEGNHYQTGNHYQAYLYYRELGGVNDRVIGYGTLSTGEEIKEHDKDKELNPIQKLLKEMAPR